MCIQIILTLYFRSFIITGHSAHKDEVTIVPFVGVDTTNSTSNSRTGRLSFLTQSTEINE